MFHRVKSEVAENEQKSSQEPETRYRDEDTRPAMSSRVEQEKQEVAEEKPSRPSYSAASQPKTQEEPARGNYQPSISRSTGGYTGGSSSYAAGSSTSSSASAYSSPSPVSDLAYSGGDRVLTIGRGINMSGEIDSCEHLLVEGTVEAALKGAKMLDIAESGTFYGTVEIEEATIAGRFEGDITVNGRLTIKETGVITGSIAYRELAVEAGAMLDGRMTPLKPAADPRSADKYRAGSDASAMAKAQGGKSKKDDREPANAENGLFSKAHASY